MAAAGAVLLCAPEAFGRAGGGSFGFGGGRSFGGGGGGLGRAFGHGHFFFFPVGGGGGGFGGVILAIIVILILVRVVWPILSRWLAGQQTAGRAARRQTALRERRVELAAAEAAEDNPAFAPDVVKPAAAKLYTDIQAAWDRQDRIALRGLVAPSLLAEWERRLDDFGRRGWRNRVQPLGQPKVEYVGLVNRGGDEEDRVTVRIEARLRDFVEDGYGQRIHRTDALGDITQVREFWTLGLRGGHWILVSIEQGAEGVHALSDEIVASPWSDERRMRDEALVEGAVAEAVPEGTSLADIADLDFTGDARAAANDLSVADGRFAPDVLEVAARRAVAAWIDAIDGEDDALNAIAHPAAARELLHPGDPSERTRLVVRGLQVKRIGIAALDAAAQPPTMTVDVELHGRRYLEDRDTGEVLAGSQAHAAGFVERWTLALDGPASEPWRIAAVGTTAERA
jgi:predicted lipid-binding transport protein (Tim44 family)